MLQGRRGEFSCEMSICIGRDMGSPKRDIECNKQITNIYLFSTNKSASSAPHTVAAGMMLSVGLVELFYFYRLQEVFALIYKKTLDMRGLSV